VGLVVYGHDLTCVTVERVAFFQEVSRENGGKALEISTILSKIQEYAASYSS